MFFNILELFFDFFLVFFEKYWSRNDLKIVCKIFWVLHNQFVYLSLPDSVVRCDIVDIVFHEEIFINFLRILITINQEGLLLIWEEWSSHCQISIIRKLKLNFYLTILIFITHFFVSLESLPIDELSNIKIPHFTFFITKSKH